MVKWTNPARNDLKEIHDFIKKDSPYYAKKVIAEIINKTKILNEFPKMGNLVPETNIESIREVFQYSYRIIYRIKKIISKSSLLCTVKWNLKTL